MTVTARVLNNRVRMRIENENEEWRTTEPSLTWVLLTDRRKMQKGRERETDALFENVQKVSECPFFFLAFLSRE